MKCESVWTIFNDPPEENFWGLRGNVYMWNLMRSACWNYDELTVKEFDELVATVYRKATGHDLQGEGEDFVPLFETVGYGMSRGYVSRRWWLDRGLPILRERLQRLRLKKREEKETNFQSRLYLAAHKVDWRKVGKFLTYPKPFDEEVFRQDLLSWIRSLKFYNHGLSEERRRLKMLALFNYLWESNCIVLQLARNCSWPSDKNTNSNVGFFSILPLLYYETSMWSAPEFFWGNDGHEADALRLRTTGEQDHEMSGIMCNCMKMHENCGTFDISTSDNSEVLKHLHKHQWPKPCPSEPAPVLGLSFHAQGLENVFGDTPWVIEKEQFAALSGWAVWFSHEPAYNDWTKRYLMFILAQRLYIYRNVPNIETSLERWLLAVLYLRYYRMGADGLLGWPSLQKEWQAISDEKKEDEAAACRRVLIETSRRVSAHGDDSV